MPELSGKKWSSFSEFIEQANANCNWLVLRNFEYLPNNFSGNDTDVDILCEDVEQFTKAMGITKRSIGVGAYQATIGGEVIPFDVRFLGDGYYDKLWQYKMLKTRTYTNDGVPRPSNEHYFYSLIYHAKIQKKSVKEAYRERFFSLAKVLGIEDYSKNHIDDNEYIATILDSFMRENHFCFSEPIDKNIPRNELFFQCLSHYVTQNGGIYRCQVSPLTRHTKFMPKFFLKLIPKKVKDFIKGAF